MVRARASIETGKNDRQSIVVTEIPYQVNKANLIEKIADMVNDKKLEDIADIRDESDRDGLRIVIDLRRDANAEVILNNLYKHTQMQTTFGVIMLALVDGRPKVLTLKEIMQHFIEHRNDGDRAPVAASNSKKPKSARISWKATSLRWTTSTRSSN